ncbi:MAG: hypothetical protein WDM76_02690 [Limisphaerales bacterium]
MAGAFEFTLNGKPVRVKAISPNTTLLEFLRANNLTARRKAARKAIAARVPWPCSNAMPMASQRIAR